MDRCRWVKLKNPLYVAYHDEEWGRPLREEQPLCELFLLETFQAGLSWETILNKREAFRKAFDGFDIGKIAAYDEDKIEELMGDAGIIRNRRKIEAAVKNSRILLKIRQEYGGFSEYLWQFTDGKVIPEPYTERTASPLSDEISKDLKKRGMGFVGSTMIYSFLQAAGVLNAHGPECSLCPGKRRNQG